MKYKNCGIRAVCLTVWLLSLLTTNSPINAFNSTTHKYVTETSLKMISEVNKEDFCFNEDEDQYWKLVANYSLKPDEDEIEGAFKYHFYNPATEKNFMGEEASALTKCSDHFNNAISYYTKGDKVMAYQELGRSIHFMEDLNTPVHTAYTLPTDSVIKFPLHVRFEKICDKISSRCLAEICVKNLEYFTTNSIETIAKSSSLLSGDNFYYLSDKEKPGDEEIARNAILNAQHKVTGLLYKFFKQVKG